jgi:dTDP-glucose 4,6-dehydratase
MAALVTGDTGFIGSHMRVFLETQGVEAMGYSRSRGHDLFNRSQLEEAMRGVNVVYHFAAEAKPGESVLRPWETIKENLLGTLNVLEACRKHDLMLIYPSSCEIYGDYDRLIVEADELKPPNPYSASKAALDRICFTYHKCYGLNVKIVRLFNPYGPRQQLSKVIPTFYRQALEGKPITVYGDGSDSRDYVYISDIVLGLWMANKLLGGEAVNLATGVATTNLELARMVIEETESSSEVRFVDYPNAFGGIRNQVGFNDKARRLMGWSPEVNLRQGLRRTIEWLETIKEGTR